MLEDVLVMGNIRVLGKTYELEKIHFVRYNLGYSLTLNSVGRLLRIWEGGGMRFGIGILGGEVIGLHGKMKWWCYIS